MKRYPFAVVYRIGSDRIEIIAVAHGRCRPGYWKERLSPQPPVNVSESKFLRPFDDMQDLWGRIDADAAIPGFTGPLLLRAGYTLAAFSAELAGLRTQFAAVTEAENGLSIGRRQRDALLPPLRERLLQYRAV